MTPTESARLLLSARRDNQPVSWRDMVATSLADAYATQDLTLAAIGPIGGWKAGAKGASGEPHCAPLPSDGLLPSGAVLRGDAWRRRGIEVEVALRVGRDIDPQGRLLPPAELAPHFDALLPAIEVVEHRLRDPQGADPLAGLADLLSHGALVLGTPVAASPERLLQLNLRTQAATLAFNGRTVADEVGTNPAQDLWRLLAWLALHCAQRGLPLRKGQIVTTGTCTGLLEAPEGAWVHGEVAGIGAVGLRFGDGAA